MAIEYAISAGPGTLIDYGVAYGVDVDSDTSMDVYRDWEGYMDMSRCFSIFMSEEVQFLISRCPDDCETGR